MAECKTTANGPFNLYEHNFDRVYSWYGGM